MQKGFTIVEIVIVIIVVGILAGLTIVGYGAWRERAAITAVKNDLLAADVVMKAAQDRETGFPTVLPSSFSPSNGVTLILKPGSNATFYCFEATVADKPGVTYFLDNDKNTQPAEGTCTMPYSPPATPAIITSFQGGYGFAVHPSSDYAYYTNSIGSAGAIRKVPLVGGNSESFINSPTDGVVRSMIFDTQGRLYVAGGTTVYRINLETSTSEQIVSGLSGPSSLYLDGNDTLYIGGSRDLYKFTLSTATLQSLNYNTSNPSYRGIVKVGEYLYMVKSSFGLARFNTVTNQFTYSYAPAPSTESAGNLVESGGKIYNIVGANLYVFNTADSTWSVAKSDVKVSSCSYPHAIGKKYGYLFYIGRIDPAATSCASPTGGFGVQTLTL